MRDVSAANSKRTGPGKRHLLLAVVVFSIVFAAGARAQSDEELARQLVNPFTELIRLPVELDYDRRIGPGNGGRAYTLVAQPLVPISLNPDWTILSRTILTAVAQRDIFPGAGSQTGFGDTLQSFFLSPRKTTAGGIAWGVGPAILLPTASDELLGARKWGLGPTAGVFRDFGPWTVGILANHIWSVRAGGNGGSFSSTYLQPALSYTRDVWSYTLQTEATYYWKGAQWSLPLEASVARLVNIGGQQVNLEAGVRYWADNPDSGPKGWGLSFTVTVLLPK